MPLENPADLIGWGAALVLLLTIGRQVYSQWKSGSTQGVSRWLFIGQMAASVGFVAYSWAVENWVFVVTNAFMLCTAVIGQLIYRRNVRLEAKKPRQASPATARA